MQNMTSINVLLKGLFSGYSFRSKVEHDPEGEIRVIQMKDLQDGYTTINPDLNRVAANSIPAKYLLQKGDVLFLSKGSNNLAITYDLENEQTVVAASAFFVLRPDQSKVIPEYLTWYLNQQPVQQYLLDNRAGTYIPNVNKKTIEGIQINLPEKKLQEKIVKIDLLKKRDYLLTEQLLAKRDQVVSSQLLQILNS